MTDTTRPPAPAPDSTEDLIDTAAPFPRRFVPVPRASKRSDGWTSDRQHAFIAALARLPSVAAAARSVGMRPGSAYRLRQAPGALDFRRAWAAALEIGRLNACDAALDRALEGELVAIRRYGRIVDQERRRNDRLLLAVLSSARGWGVRPQPPRRARRPDPAVALAREIADFEFDERVMAAARPFLDAMAAPPPPPRVVRIRRL